MRNIKYGSKVKVICKDNRSYASSLGKIVTIWTYFNGDIKMQMYHKNFEAFFLGLWRNDPEWAVIWNPEICLVQIIQTKDIDYL